MPKLKKAGRSVRVISLVLALATLALVLAFVVPKPVAADPYPCGVDILYFSDASHTVTVGERAWTHGRCGCRLFSWGSTSAYSLTGITDWC
jgi:hypothetical protein